MAVVDQAVSREMYYLILTEIVADRGFPAWVKIDCLFACLRWSQR